MNPSIEKEGLSLNIDMDDNALDFDLARSVGEFFQLKDQEMEKILREVKAAVTSWRRIADEIGIPRQEQELMEPAFRY